MFRYRFVAALAIGSFVGLPVAGGAHATTIDAPSVPRDVLYVSDFANDDVLAFDASPRAKNRQPLLTIPVGAHPSGLWVDRHGVLYVAAYESVLEYKPGATAPFRTITAGVTGAVALTVDAAGTLYVVNHSGQNVTVVEYSAGSRRPAQTLTITEPDSLFGFAGGITFDAAGNLYVAATFYPEANGRVFRFAPGQTTGTDLGLSAVGSQDGLAIDAKGNLYVGYFGPVEVYAPGATQPSATIGKGSDYPSLFALSPQGVLYEPVTAGIPSNSSLVEFGTNPSKQVDHIGGFFSAPVGAAVRSAAF